MKNIERRRRQRKLLPLIILAAVVLCALSVLLTVIIKHGRAKKANASALVSPVPVETSAADLPAPEATAYLTEAAETSGPSAAPSVTEAPSAAPSKTAAPSPEESEAPTAAPSSGQDEPIRISDENSLVILTLSVSKRFDSSGNIYGFITGQCAISFVNNTDRALYTASFRLGADKVDSVTLDGISARYSFSEDGLLEIPFVNELKMGESCEVFFEFTARVRAEESFSPLVFGYDTAYSLTAYIESGVKLNITGCKASEKTQGKSCFYTVNDRTVHAIGIAIVY